MIVTYKQNCNNLRKNMQNIKDFNYIKFSERQWKDVGARLNKHLPNKYCKKPYKLDLEATRVNPIVKMFFGLKVGGGDYICIKLTPYEVMVAENAENSFRYSRILTREWQSILQEVFGDAYEQAKNKHYGIQTL